MDIFNRFTRKVIFSAEVENIGELLREAIRAGTDLRGVDLCGADLCGADLSRADLRGGDLCLADLRGTNLSGTNLSRANLSGADLNGANLCGTDLGGADLRGVHAQINGHDVLQVNGLPYSILITDTYLQAECQTHTFAAWRNMTEEELVQMDGKKALDFYPELLRIMDFFCKDREAVA